MEKNLKRSISMFMATTLVMATMSQMAFAQDNVSTNMSDVQILEEELIRLNPLELRERYKELKIDYDFAIESGDLEQQIILITEGNIILEKLMAAEEEYQQSSRNVFGTTYKDYFEKSYWITRDGEISLSIYPINLAWSTSQIETTWDIIRGVHESDREWDNTQTMRSQYWCHVNFAGSMKTPWNIEPWKTSINPFTCN